MTGDRTVKIKICGLKRPEDIGYVNEALPDYAGFVVEVPGSRRSVDRDAVRRLSAGLDDRIIPIGVFVDAPPELPAGLLKEGIITVAQLHGCEDEKYIEQLREMGGQPYWHVGLREESSPPHWNILDPFYAKHIKDYRYGENWLAYRRPPEGEEHCYG